MSAQFSSVQFSSFLSLCTHAYRRRRWQEAPCFALASTSSEHRRQ